MQNFVSLLGIDGGNVLYNMTFLTMRQSTFSFNENNTVGAAFASEIYRPLLCVKSVIVDIVMSRMITDPGRNGGNLSIES